MAGSIWTSSQKSSFSSPSGKRIPANSSLAMSFVQKEQSPRCNNSSRRKSSSPYTTGSVGGSQISGSLLSSASISSLPVWATDTWYRIIPWYSLSYMSGSK